MYSNATVATVNQEDDDDDDVCFPIMAYSVGTLDQRDGETSHLSKPQTCECFKQTFSAWLKFYRVAFNDPPHKTIVQSQLTVLITDYRKSSNPTSR